MPKRPYYESAIHHLLLQLRRIANEERLATPHAFKIWEQWINSFEFSYIDHETINVGWSKPKKGHQRFSIADVQYYTRGDVQSAKNTTDPVSHDDRIRKKNDALFTTIAKKLAKKAGIKIHKNTGNSIHAHAKIHEEEELSDTWAQTVDPSSIDIIHTNTACTSPELRYIHRKLGNIQGKRVLDLGCGLGEASIFFALKGAKVTAVDLSQPMLDVVVKIAKKYSTSIKTMQASVEELDHIKKHSFDIIYVGNVFHHVDVQKTLRHITRILTPDGILVCWEPVGYNPIINIYRNIARSVRSSDERPFRKHDIEQFKKHFSFVRITWFWFTTLIIFVIMATIELRNPNKERYWKVVIKESEKWKPLYVPLEKIDRAIISLFPFLGYLCWNTVLICKYPTVSSYAR